MEKKTNGSTILRAMTRDGSARVLVINSRKMVNDMAAAHKTSPTATAALGRTITAASMIGTMLPEDKDSLTIGFFGDGEAGKILAMPLPQTPDELSSRRRKIGELIEKFSIEH